MQMHSIQTGSALLHNQRALVFPEDVWSRKTDQSLELSRIEYNRIINNTIEQYRIIRSEQSR